MEHGFWIFDFMSFSVTNLRHSLNSMTIPCHLSRFYLLSMLKLEKDFGQVQVMEFSWSFPIKMMGFPSDLVSFSTKLLSKRHEKIRITFFKGYIHWNEFYSISCTIYNLEFRG